MLLNLTNVVPLIDSTFFCGVIEIENLVGTYNMLKSLYILAWVISILQNINDFFFENIHQAHEKRKLLNEEE
jgi:hypothetical protein